MDDCLVFSLRTAVRARRIGAVLVAWGCLTSAASWLVGPRSAPAPLEVFTVPPAHGTPPAADVALLRRTDLLLRTAMLLQATTTTTTTAKEVRIVVRAPAHRGPSPVGECGGYRDLFARYAWDVGTACRIVGCESGFDASNYNGRSRGIAWSPNRASGLWQHLPAPDGWADPVVSTELAWSKYQARGWQPWSASAGCW